MNRAVLAAFLCSATAPAAMCEVTPQMSPFNAGQWSALADTRATSRAMAEPNTFTPIELPDATILMPKSSTAGGAARAPVNALPVTSTAPDDEPESGLR